MYKLSITFVTALFLVFLIPSVLSTDCWNYDESQTDCELHSDECRWMEDAWGSWCEQKGCWNFWNSGDCSNSTAIINKACIWRTSSGSGWCEQKGCWSYDGTNQTMCEVYVNASYGLDCVWEDSCVGPSEKECWTYGSETTCENVTGCLWGMCNDLGCWNYDDNQTACEQASFNGNPCEWNDQYDYCYEVGCWDYPNMTSCLANGCEWSGSCYEKMCSSFDYTNSTACESSGLGVTCEWNDPYCNEKGCWNYGDNTSCDQDNACVWSTYSGGWCEQVGCWSFDGNESGCGNATDYGLNCVWDPAGWCYEDMGSKECSNITNERDCMDTFYCIWNDTCNDPSSFGFSDSGDFDVWNPGCFIFDMNQTICENYIRNSSCYWNASSSTCLTNVTMVPDMQLNCTFINNSNLCNSIPAFGSCCSWQAGQCVEDKWTTACWDQMQEPPEGAYYCDDYNAFTDDDLCAQIAGSPWFMPCSWNNETERCGFKAGDVFEEGKENIMFIDNKQNCEAAGGKWVKESYCEATGNGDYVAVSTGRCEFKFDEARTCDRDCFACEFQPDKTNWTSKAIAKKKCIESAVGFCQFTEDSSAPNGFGYCEPKDECKKGLVTGDCKSECSACTYMGDPFATDYTLRPKYYCEEFSDMNCKWIADPSDPDDQSKGRCASASEKTCEDRCDKCYDQTVCVSAGAKKGDTSIEAVCEWDTDTNICVYKSGASDMEICWDGVDNNNDNKIDCADSMCWSDSFCGGGYMSDGGTDCFAYDNNQTACEQQGCSWMNEDWGTWCDIPGANCWKNDGNETACTNTGFCEWHGGFGGYCEDNWTIYDACLGMDNVTCAANAANNCTWIVDDWCEQVGGWCEFDTSSGQSWIDCSQRDWVNQSQVYCELDSACRWQEDSWCAEQGGGSSGFCDHLKFSCFQYSSQPECENTTDTYLGEFCEWHDEASCVCDTPWYDGGCSVDCMMYTYSESECGNHASDGCTWTNDTWCQEKGTGSGGQNCWDIYNSTNCTNAGCDWISGFCDPPGFGSDTVSSGGEDMGGYGMQCFVHDGNQTACENTTGCGWFSEYMPFCQVDTSSNCPQYSYNSTICSQHSECIWSSEMQFCDEKPFECFWNQTLNIDEGNCTTNSLCQWKPGADNGTGCEPKCFTMDSSSCASASECAWIDGWCNPAMATEMFQGMEEGPPVVLGGDPAGDASPDEIDIIGLGMKDMGNAFGFGASVVSFNDAAACNGIKMSNEFGNGNVTTKFYFYLDTDGSTSGGCFLNHDSSEDGFEFYIKSVWRYDNSTDKGVETTSVYRCSQGSWTKAEISSVSVAQKMCAEIQGGMVAFEKTDLEKYPSLYSAGSDIRVVVATANGTGDEDNPSDWMGDGWATPGAVDFDLDEFDMFKFDQDYDPCSGKQGQDKGYVEYDADCWTEAGCADYSCKGHPYCEANSYGVEADDFVDTRMPSIVGIMKEVYPDSALISYFTDKPANGTLYFYGNDSVCQTLNATVPDRGVYSSYMNQYKLWHVSEIYNGSHSLNYTLDPDTQYYYKLKVCDENGKCGTSKCASFVTETDDTCPFCRFVTRIKTPTGWDVYYDQNQDGTYEHWQGNVCGTKAGMKTNYTSGRRVNIKLQKSDGSTYIEFVNARLTKTGLNTRTRDIEDSDSLKAGTTNSIGYAGMPSATRDKIVNNLNPEYCRIKIAGTGSCTSLWHCDDDGDNCVDRTSESTVSLVSEGSNYCIWQIPCEFSVWAGGNIAYQGGTGGDDDDGSSGGGGPTGGGGASSSDVDATRRPELVPGVGLRNNTKLQAAMERVLGMANMSEEIRQNMLRLSETITSQVSMTRNLRSSNGSASLETRLSYSGSQMARNFMLFDTVPKEFAQHSDNVTVTAAGATVEIVESDPEYLFTYDQLNPDDEIVITYSVGSDIEEAVMDSFSGEVYAQGLEEPPACVDGATQCSLNDVHVCQDGEWVIQETCPYGCSGGACVAAPPLSIDDSTTMMIIIIIVAAVIVIGISVFLLKKKSGGKKDLASKSPEPVTPSSQSFAPGG